MVIDIIASEMFIAETMIDTEHFSCPWEMWAGKDASWMIVGNALMFLASVAPSLLYSTRS